MFYQIINLSWYSSNFYTFIDVCILKFRMIKKFLLISIILLGLPLSGQTAISGYIDTAETHFTERKVFLTKISLNDVPDFKKAIKIASSTIDDEGFFEFKRIFTVLLSIFLQPKEWRISTMIEDEDFACGWRYSSMKNLL